MLQPGNGEVRGPVFQTGCVRQAAAVTSGCVKLIRVELRMINGGWLEWVNGWDDGDGWWKECGRGGQTEREWAEIGKV